MKEFKTKKIDLFLYFFQAIDSSLLRILNPIKETALHSLEKIKKNSFLQKACQILSRYLTRFMVICMFFFLSSDVFAGCGDNANPALKTLCDILRLLHGRLGRAFVMVTLILSAYQFITDSGLSWKPIVQLLIGMAMFWAPKTTALFILPAYITGVQGEGYTPNQILTPDEILSCACPDLY